MQTLAVIVKELPIGTNLALLQFLWMLVSGALLTSRGALLPALQAIGLKKAEVRRSWAAFRYGAWAIGTMLQAWRQHVEGQGQWQAHRYAGYIVKAVDVTAFWRPKLKGLKSKHYDSQADKALPAVVVGMVGRVGSVGKQRMALMTDLLCADLDKPCEAAFETQLLATVLLGLAEDEMPVFDAGFKPKALREAGYKRFAMRLAKNFSARRNLLPKYDGVGRPPEYGERIRPLARSFKEHQIAATPPDRSASWTLDGVAFRAEFWDNLVLPDTKPGEDTPTFTVAAIYDPEFEEPWLLACPLKLSGPDLWSFYNDRWPIEQLPLAGKHMVGAHRQFVFAPESCRRLPELSLLAGSVQTYLAASLPPIPTGFWDRKPRSTPGRLRRLLTETRFSDLSIPWQARIREKRSIWEHLPKGILGHRGTKQVKSA
jgi:hypothetical protein